MCERDGLGLLSVRIRGDDRVARIFRTVDEHTHEVLDLLDPVVDGAPQIESQIEGDLVVAGSSGMETTGVLTDQLTEATFDGGVNVLIAIPELEPSRMRLAEDALEPFFDPGDGIGVEQADLAEHGDVGKRPGDVVDEQTPIGVVRRETPQRLVGPGGEATAPQSHEAPPAVVRDP
jgi:hypothetical protein